MAATTREASIDFFGGIPHRVAHAGLSAAQAENLADQLERLVILVQDLGYPPAAVDGPDPESFPSPWDRIAAAANQLAGLVQGIPDHAWSDDADGETVDAELDLRRRELEETYGL